MASRPSYTYPPLAKAVDTLKRYRHGVVDVDEDARDGDKVWREIPVLGYGKKRRGEFYGEGDAGDEEEEVDWLLGCGREVGEDGEGDGEDENDDDDDDDDEGWGDLFGGGHDDDDDDDDNVGGGGGGGGGEYDDEDENENEIFSLGNEDTKGMEAAGRGGGADIALEADALRRFAGKGGLFTQSFGGSKMYSWNVVFYLSLVGKNVLLR